jgi:L-glyceraldehyde 3-phosphate reductase
MTYEPDAKRYDGVSYRRCGRSGISLPPISLGLWQNFGGVNVLETGRAVLPERRELDTGACSE